MKPTPVNTASCFSWRLIVGLFLLLAAFNVYHSYSEESGSIVSHWRRPSVGDGKQLLPQGTYLAPAVPESYLAICMAVKEQALDLQEFFVHHYYHVGIRRFYIMDDGSSPPLSSFEYPGVPRSVLTFDFQDPSMRTTEQFMAQPQIYSRCMDSYGDKHTWMAFIDADEFFELTSSETLQSILEDFEAKEHVGALVVNWKQHTSGGLITRPESARKAFLECVSDADYWHKGELLPADNKHIKTIVKTSKALSPLGAHMWNLKDGTYSAGEHGDWIDPETWGWRSPITRDRITLHHYVVKSRQEFLEKLHRGNAQDNPKRENFWNLVEHVWPHVRCTEMAKYNP